VNVTWSEEAIRALGVKTDVETAGAIFGMSRTHSYEAAKAGRFPVPVVPVGNRLLVPVAPILRLLEIGADATQEIGTRAVDPEELADMVAERVVSRLAAAMVGAARPQAAEEPPRPLKSVAGGSPEAA
jgi:hypothetical protein